MPARSRQRRVTSSKEFVEWMKLASIQAAGGQGGYSLATVTSQQTSPLGVRVQFAGDVDDSGSPIETATTFAYLGPQPDVGATVVMQKFGKTWIVLGALSGPASTANMVGLIGSNAVSDGATRTATSFATATDLCTVSITPVTGRNYRVRGWIDALSATYASGNGMALCSLAFNGSAIGLQGNYHHNISGVGVSAFAEYVGTLAITTANASIRIWCGASVTGVIAANLRLTVEDLG